MDKDTFVKKLYSKLYLLLMIYYKTFTSSFLFKILKYIHFLFPATITLTLADSSAICAV